jgi:hypothetical protein
MSCYEKLNTIFETYEVSDKARAEIRQVVCLAREEAEQQGYSDGWTEGQSHCDLDR